MASSTALLVRLPNHLGDTLMALPALDRLAAAGYSLTLLGRAWAGELLAAHGWRFESAARGLRAQAAQIAALRESLGADTRALVLTNSLSSAAKFALGGLRATGYASDGRSLLLARAIAVPPAWRRGTLHMVEYYDALAAAFLGAPVRTPPAPALRLGPQPRAQAQQLLADAGIDTPYVVLCPGARGVHQGQQKTWSGFRELSARLATAEPSRKADATPNMPALRLVALPGPGERDDFEAALTATTLLPPTDVATFAALLQASRLVVANDSGPSHLAAAVGARLVTVFGVTEPARTRPWTEHAELVGGPTGWPTVDAVHAAVQRALARPVDASARDTGSAEPAQARR